MTQDAIAGSRVALCVATFYSELAEKLEAEGYDWVRLGVAQAQ
jgi:hypothetical protein